MPDDVRSWVEWPVSRRVRLTLGAALLAMPAVVIATTPQDGAALVVFSYAAPTEVVLHQPIPVTIEVRNSRMEPVRLRLGLGASRSFVVTISRPDGSVFRAPAFPELKEGVYDSGRRSVAGLGQYTHPLVVNQWFRFDHPGSYRIEIDLQTPVETDAGLPVPARTRGVLTVRVRERDQAALHGVCQELVERIRNAQDGADLHAASVELAYVTDPLALSYMTQVLDFTDRADSYLIPALVRMNTREARTILAEMAHGHDEGRVSQAMQALHDLATGRRR